MVRTFCCSTCCDADVSRLGRSGFASCADRSPSVQIEARPCKLFLAGAAEIVVASAPIGPLVARRIGVSAGRSTVTVLDVGATMRANEPRRTCVVFRRPDDQLVESDVLRYRRDRRIVARPTGSTLHQNSQRATCPSSPV